jgi:hypothetical protein
MRLVTITGWDAHYLLFALDKYCETNREGKVTKVDYRDGLSGTAVQDLRDRLFDTHEHPEEND